jgi:hypothetical protein
MTIKENNISQGMGVQECIYFRGWGEVGKMLKFKGSVVVEPISIY